MEILMNIWVAFNLVFGLFTTKNECVKIWGKFIGVGYKQNTFGMILDKLVLVSILSYILTVY